MGYATVFQSAIPPPRNFNIILMLRGGYMNLKYYNIFISLMSTHISIDFDISGFFVSIPVHKSGCTHSHILCYI